MSAWTLGALVGALALGAGPDSQEASIYTYDMHGRLVNNSTAASVGNSNISNYVYDSADNRSSHSSNPLAPRASDNALSPGEVLIAGLALVSNDMQSRLDFRPDGALVISCNGVDQLTLVAPNGAATQFVMQGDGNLVLYNYAPAALWATATNGYPGAYLVLQDDGNAVVYSGATALWSSATSC